MSIIIIYLITEIFVGRFKKFMNYMRVFGYSISEINKVFMWIFIPLTLFTTFLGVGFVFLMIYSIIPNILVYLQIVLPLLINFAYIPIPIILSFSVFLTAYIIIIILKFIKTKT